MTKEQVLELTEESLSGMSRSELYQLSVQAQHLYCFTLRCGGETREERRAEADKVLIKVKMIEDAYNATFEPWEHMFDRLCGPSEYATAQISCSWLPHPKAIHTLQAVTDADNRAQKLIESAESLIEQLKSYRATVGALYGTIATAPTIPGIELNRYTDPRENNKVFFELTTYTRFTDGDSRTESNTERFTGTERREAIAKYKAYIHSHPGIEHKTNIDGI